MIAKDLLGKITTLFNENKVEETPVVETPVVETPVVEKDTKIDLEETPVVEEEIKVDLVDELPNVEPVVEEEGLTLEGLQAQIVDLAQMVAELKNIIEPEGLEEVKVEENKEETLMKENKELMEKIEILENAPVTEAIINQVKPVIEGNTEFARHQRWMENNK